MKQSFLNYQNTLYINQNSHSKFIKLNTCPQLLARFMIDPYSCIMDIIVEAGNRL